MVATGRTFDCAELLSHVQRTESMLPASSESLFGHPPPPESYILRLPRGNIGLVAAITRRCVSAQLFKNGVSQGEPLDTLCLASPDDEAHVNGNEETSCATLLHLDSAMIQGDDVLFASVVVGTNQCRVLAVELEIRLSDGSASLSMMPPFEPLPLDNTDGVADDGSIMSSKSGVSDALRHSRHGTPHGDSSLGPSRHRSAPKKDTPGKEGIKPVKFSPDGSVTSLSSYRVSLNADESRTCVVWVAYGDGTMVRLHHAAFFSTVVLDTAFHDVLAASIIRSRVLLPQSVGEVTVLPLPKYHPSPLAPLPPWKPPRHEDEDEMALPARTTVLSDDEDRQEDDDDVDNVFPDFHEALVYVGDTAGAGSDQFPTLAFYTSENQFFGRMVGEDNNERSTSSNQDAGLLDHVIGGTTALVSGVFGTAFGVVKWGLGHRDHQKATDEGAADKHKDGDMLDPSKGELESDLTVMSPTFPAIHREPSNLFAGVEIHDAPRQIVSATVDPEGNLAATTDTLGRVLLIDLCSKQVARIFKGWREASCGWIEVPRPRVENLWQKQKILFLAIHSRQRRTIDIYRTRHGPRVKSIHVDRDSQLIQSSHSDEFGSFACCYLLQSSSTGTALNQMELLTFDEKSSNEAGTHVDVPGIPSRGSGSLHEATMRLQLLQQILAKTNVPSERQDVFEAFTQITSLKDLCTALDVLAVSSQLEDAMGVIGSEFHSIAVAHCKQTLEHVIRDGGSHTVENAQVKMLASRIVYHSQLVEAYDALHEFETKSYGQDEHDEIVAPRSAWAVEGLAWLTMYETVTGTSIDVAIVKQTRSVLPFWAFAKACSDSKQIIPLVEKTQNVRHTIYLTDSTRSRKEVLVHIFKPLLRDIFAFNVVGSVFDSMGIKGDLDYLLQCFGDWFVSIPAREAARKGLFCPQSPMVRWLQDTVTSELEDGATQGDKISKPLLFSIHKFCSEATDLVRAFLLATLCREAVSIATRKKEAKTYGKVSSMEAVKPWNDLLRKLRVSLLVSLRLNGMNLGAFPITVKNVEADGKFSVYEWLARDELTMSHNHQEIVSLENACRMSGLVFDPSSEAGDNPGRWKMLQQACLVAAISEEEREEFLLDINDDDQLGALLLYMSHHNNPALLVAHRALLLAQQWIGKPNDLQPLRDCLEALRGLHDDETYKPLSNAIRLEVWQSAVRPFYRAILFGFDDVHELTEDIAGPLLDDRVWVRGLGMIALPMLDMLIGVTWNDSMNVFKSGVLAESAGWPPVKEDFVLKRIVEKSRPVISHSLDIHRVVVCGCLVSDDMETLSAAVPDHFETFLPTSLFHPTTGGMGNTEKQMEFLEQAVINHANEMEGDVLLGRLNLAEIDLLALLWGVDLKDTHTLFFLAMYELGKDNIVDESLSLSTTSDLDIVRFISDGLGIACRRLNHALNVKRSSEMRAIMGMLDADTCEWLREQAEESLSLLEGDDGDVKVSNSNTHLLILRLLGFCAMVGDTETATKIHSLSVLSGTILKVLDQT